jgi:dTDP-4-dehydrorhamnose reductase
MLRLGREKGAVSVVHDQVLSPTYTVHLARAIWRLIGADAQGLYHVTSEGSCSWYEFAKSIFEFAELSAVVRPISTADSETKVRRPAYSVLAKKRLAADGYPLLPIWTAGLKSYLATAEEGATGRPARAEMGVTNAES